mmetsp:Transcript_12627/g.16282  ORF Transcript_12627/g.16282 Transcript_12627/m.16282 type:complete len:204 (-) Transcript_12627:690-1301(-)
MGFSLAFLLLFLCFFLCPCLNLLLSFALSLFVFRLDAIHQPRYCFQPIRGVNHLSSCIHYIKISIAKEQLQIIFIEKKALLNYFSFDLLLCFSQLFFHLISKELCSSLFFLQTSLSFLFQSLLLLFNKSSFFFLTFPFCYLGLFGSFLGSLLLLFGSFESRVLGPCPLHQIHQPLILLLLQALCNPLIFFHHPSFLHPSICFI